MGSSRSGRPLPPLLGLAVAAAGVAAMMAAGLLLGRQLGVPLRISLIVASLLLMTPGLLALALGGRSFKAGLALHPLGRHALLLSAALGLTLWVASLGLLELQYAVWPPPPGYLEAFRRLHAALRPTGPLDALVSLVSIAVAPAICEEILVRGIVLPSFREALGAAGAVLASAVVFAVMHADAYRFVFTFAVGLVLGLVRLRAGALVPTILAHATLNSLTFLAAPLVDDPSQPMPAPRPLLGAALLVVGAGLTLLPVKALRGGVDSAGSST